MQSNKRIFTIVLLVLCLTASMSLSACMTISRVDVTFDSSHTVYANDTLDSLRPYLKVRFVNALSMGMDVDNYTLSGTLTEGECTIFVHYAGMSTAVTITVVPATSGDGGDTDVGGGTGGDADNKDDGNTGGKDDTDEDFTTDPYLNMTSAQFYSNYTPAKSYWDAYWRTQHHFMSGSIDNQNQAPTVASNQPKSGSNLIRNSDSNYADNGNTWQVVDSNGNVVNKIYKGGAYVTLEEVAAYVYAFGDIPANYDSNKDNKDAAGYAWGKYLRVNNSRYYNNNTGNYAYEPKLPETGPGGTMQYYEIDIGTTGYNNGTGITRGTARIVYTRYYSNGKLVDDLQYRYVFYTYNHYNDFQEYLNYQNGWGTRFGNVSNGGTVDKGSNPSPYVQVTRQSFNTLFA